MSDANTPIADEARTWKNSFDELCTALRISEGDLSHLLANRHRYYYIKPYTSRTGKQRTFYVARGKLLIIHDRLLRWLSRQPIHAAAHGWRKGRSPLTAVATHVGKPCLINLDIADFYPTIWPRRVRNVFLRLGCAPEIADVLTRLTTYKSHLAQGLKTSPTLANLVMTDIDRRIDIAAQKLAFAYTRYGDDITLSGHKEARKMESLAISILRQTGFDVNPEKTERCQKHERQTVLKTVVNAKPNLPVEKRKRLRAIAHNCFSKGIASEQQDGEELQKTIARIRGLLSHWASINPQAALSSQRKFEQAVKKNTLMTAGCPLPPSLPPGRETALSV